MSEQKIVTNKCLNFVCIWRKKDRTCNHLETCKYTNKELLKYLSEYHPEKLQEMPLLDLWDLCYFYEYGVIKEPQSQYCFFPPESDNPFIAVYEERRKKEQEAMTKGDW